MMLHRHFEAEKNKNENVTTLADVTAKSKEDEFVSEIFPPEDAPKRRGRPKKTDESKD